MNREAFDEQVKRLHEVNDIISKLEPSIQAAAFDVLRPYVTGRPISKPPAGSPAGTAPVEGEDEEAGAIDFEAFLKKHAAEDVKPADSAILVTSYIYSKYGSEPFTIEEIRQLADEAGLTVPSRIDMTLKQKKSEGKAVFTQTAGGWKPTVFGETFLKATYGVRKGREKRPTANPQ